MTSPFWSGAPTAKVSARTSVARAQPHGRHQQAKSRREPWRGVPALLQARAQDRAAGRRGPLRAVALPKPARRARRARTRSRCRHALVGPPRRARGTRRQNHRLRLPCLTEQSCTRRADGVEARAHSRSRGRGCTPFRRRKACCARRPRAQAGCGQACRGAPAGPRCARIRNRHLVQIVSAVAGQAHCIAGAQARIIPARGKSRRPNVSAHARDRAECALRRAGRHRHRSRRLPGPAAVAERDADRGLCQSHGGIERDRRADAGLRPRVGAGRAPAARAGGSACGGRGRRHLGRRDRAMGPASRRPAH